jgi:hypothetical protein
MKYAYEKLMEENNLTIAELPADAKQGINQIKKIEKAIKLVQSRGKSVSNDTINQIRVNDKWIVREILDYLEDKDIDRGEMPNSAEDVIESIEEDNTPAADPKGLKIDKELKALFDAGKTSLTIDEIRSSARNAYDVIFETYERGGDNGVETSYYSLIEQQDGDYSLTSK